MDDLPEHSTDSLAQSIPVRTVAASSPNTSRQNPSVIRIGRACIPTFLVSFPTSALVHIGFLILFCWMPWRIDVLAARPATPGQRVIEVTLHLAPTEPTSKGTATPPALDAAPPRSPDVPKPNTNAEAQADPSNQNAAVDSNPQEASAPPVLQADDVSDKEPDPQKQPASQSPGDDQQADASSKTTSDESQDKKLPDVIDDAAESAQPNVPIPPAPMKVADAKVTETRQIGSSQSSSMIKQQPANASAGQSDSHTRRKPTAPPSPPLTTAKAKVPAKPMATASGSTTQATTQVRATQAKPTSSFAQARIISRPRPDVLSKYYPRRSRMKGEQGVVHLRIEVLPDGKVGKIEAVDGPSERLIKAALRVAPLCRFAPATINGRPVRDFIVVAFPFRLTPN